MFIDLNPENYYNFRDGLEAMSTGKLSLKPYHSGGVEYVEDLDLNWGDK